MAVLVTGGAGFIGSHMVLSLLDAGEDVVVIDNLATGFRWAVPPEARFHEGSAGDRDLLDRVLDEHRPDAVLHFAGSVVVPESVTDPLKYYRNNTGVSRTLIEACLDHRVGRFVFSSTAAVYGMAGSAPLREEAPLAPMSPYGRSKLMTEMMLKDAAEAHPLRYAALRYFNVAGADPQGRTGQSTLDATHLVKVACEAAVGLRDEISVFGTDYATPDGTAIRDYIHVSDLIAAHSRALDHLRRDGDSITANVGYGHGYSVREVLAAVQRVGGGFRISEVGRRLGDPEAIVADAARARTALGWSPRFDDLDVIVRHALDWQKKLLRGAHPGSVVRRPRQVESLVQ